MTDLTARIMLNEIQINQSRWSDSAVLYLIEILVSVADEHDPNYNNYINAINELKKSFGIAIGS